MDTYDQLLARAEHKGICTFGDAMQALGVDGPDIWYDEYSEDIDGEYLYYCDGAMQLLEGLADSRVI